MSGRRLWSVGVVLAAALAPGLARGGDWAEDVAAARRLLEQAPAGADAHAAIDLLNLALTQPVPPLKRPEIYYWLGRAWFLSKDAPKAIEAFRQALAGDPTSPLYKLWLGAAWAFDGRSTPAVRLLRDVYGDPATAAPERQAAGDALTQLHEPPDAERLVPPVALTSEGMVIRANAGQPFVADVREAIAEARRRLRDRLGLTPQAVVEVLVFADARSYQAYHAERQMPRPEWSTSCEGHGRIYTYPAAQSHDAAVSTRDALISTLTHEYTHFALHAEAADRPLPCWLDEGLAVLISNQFPDARRLVSQARALLSLPALSVSSFSVYGTADARLAYAQSKSMAEFMLDTSGPAALRTYLRDLAGEDPADAVFTRNFGLTPEQFFGRWLAERANGG